MSAEKSHDVRSIPIRTVQLRQGDQLPHDYSTTPGGTMFSTTPGGTRIIYDRSFLLQCRNSPLTKSPPANLPNIPGVTKRQTNDSRDIKAENGLDNQNHKENAEEPQFSMDI